MRIIRGLGWTYTAYALEAALGLATVAFVVRRIALADYGVFTLALSITGLLMLLDLGLLGLLVQAYAGEREKSGAEGVTALLGAATSRLVISGVAAFGIAAIIAFAAPHLFGVEASAARSARIVMLICGASLVFALPSMAAELAYVASRAFGALARVQVGVVALRSVLSIAVVAAGYGVIALAIVHLLAAAFRYALLAAGLSRNAHGARLSVAMGNREKLNAVRANRPWATGDNVARQLAAAADSILLGLMASTGVVALYGVAKRLPAQLQAVIGRGVDVTLPVLATHHHRDENAELRGLFTSTLAVCSAILVPVCTAGIILASRIMILLGGPQYEAAAPMLRWLLAAAMIQALSVPSYAVLYARGQIRTAAGIGVAEAVANILLTVALIPRYGGTGAAAATAITHFVGTVGWFLPAALRAVRTGAQHPSPA